MIKLTFLAILFFGVAYVVLEMINEILSGLFSFFADKTKDLRLDKEILAFVFKIFHFLFAVIVFVATFFALTLTAVYGYIDYILFPPTRDTQWYLNLGLLAIAVLCFLV